MTQSGPSGNSHLSGAVGPKAAPWYYSHYCCRRLRRLSCSTSWIVNGSNRNAKGSAELRMAGRSRLGDEAAAEKG